MRSDGENQLLRELAIFTRPRIMSSADSDQLAGAPLECHNRRLVYDDLVVVDYYRVGRTEVNCDFLCEREQSHWVSRIVKF